MKFKEGDLFRSFLSDEEYVIKKIVKSTVVLESQNGKKQILTDADNLKIRSFYKKKEGWLCLTEWDLQDGDTILMPMAEVGVGTLGGMEHPFHHGGLQPRKRRFGFSKRKPIPFGKSWTRLKKDSKNWRSDKLKWVSICLNTALNRVMSSWIYFRIRVCDFRVWKEESLCQDLMEQDHWVRVRWQVEGEVSALCHTGATVHMGTACGQLVIQPPVVIHFTEGPFMGPSSGQAVEGFHGVVAAVESSAVVEGSVVGGSNAWGPRWNPGGSTKTFFPKVDPLYSH
jgi:hypothetical protein